MEFDGLIAFLREQGLLDRAQSIQCGDIVVSLVPPRVAAHEKDDSGTQPSVSRSRLLREEMRALLPGAVLPELTDEG